MVSKAAASAPKLRYGRIPGVDKPVSRVIYGTLFLHLVGDEAATFQLLDDIWATGCNTFDCAGIYGAGVCESLLGRWMKSRRIPRDKMVIISKGGCEGQARNAPSSSQSARPVWRVQRLLARFRPLSCWQPQASLAAPPLQPR